MPLIKIKEIDTESLWGLWEIKESEKALCKTLDESIPLNINNNSRKMEALGSRILLKKMLETWKMNYAGLDNYPTGQPYLLKSDFHISLTHSKGFIAAIIHKKQKVGIDIEMIHERIAKVAPRVLSEQELEICRNDLRLLSIYWCAKETLFKIYSDGQLNYKENILIHTADQDFCIGEIKTQNFHKTFKLKIEEFDNYIITYNYYI